MSTPDPERLRSIRTFASLVKYLRDELDWPIDSDHFDDLTFDYQPEELGLDAQTAVKIREIKQLRPLVTNQPWGIFFLNFEPKRLPVVVLRRILRALVLKKRQSANRAHQATWQLNDLLFISSYGEAEHRDITFAHFSEEPATGDLPSLKVLGWDDEDTVLHLAHAHKTLEQRLRWPGEPADLESWRSTWSAAFTLRHREVITTSKALAVRLAELATAIRKRVNGILAVECEKGPLRKLHAAFKEALIHDLSEDDFADMYAQTITYGLLSARVSRPAGLIAENVADMVPVTNPFLRDMLSTFLTVGGRKGKIDFDELGINDVVQALRDANMEAVLRDFGDKNPQEDPVVHFYELFLKEYDPRKRIQRGVFYTPRPVVSFIIRSVDQILRTEFRLVDGLADTSTWGEMVKRHPEMTLPNGVKADEPFVQILDPACGTGTFLVEAIETIHKTMTAKWCRKGHMALEIPSLWNEYVSDHLLPRLYGFELMMAPYAVAHMKIGLKLHGTGYDFRSHERARVYLTNSLEKPADLSDRFEFDAPALAHEARAVNSIKKKRAFSVVVGNPPYAQYSANLSEDAKTHIEKYRYANGGKIRARNALQLERNLNDDYVKFLGWTTEGLPAEAAAFGMITNRTFLESESLIGLRQDLAESFGRGIVLDLRGGIEEARRIPRLKGDENVFDIGQGVAISIFWRRTGRPDSPALISYGELIGIRGAKLQHLQNEEWTRLAERRCLTRPPSWWLTAAVAEVTDSLPRLPDLFLDYATLVASNRDHLVTDFDVKPLVRRFNRFRDFQGTDEKLCEVFSIGLKTGWNIRAARKRLAEVERPSQFIRSIEYRPFDRRLILFHPDLIWQTSPVISSNVLDRPGNLILVSLGKNRTEATNGHWIARCLADKSVLSSRDNASGFPLYLYPTEAATIEPSWLAQRANSRIKSLGGADAAGIAETFEESRQLVQTLYPASGYQRLPNLAPRFIASALTSLGLSWVADGTGDLRKTLGPEDLLHYIYALLYSPSYRSRFHSALALGFPPVAFSSDLRLFAALSSRGADLVALHTVDGEYQAASWNRSGRAGQNPFIRTGGARVAAISSIEAGYPRFEDGRVYVNSACWFGGVPESAWTFQIGGYQVCEKWLKDRRGRVLSEEDIAHYQKIVVAIKETIRLMAEIDEVIEAHGGWPSAFVTGREAKAEASR